jgi:hypothetical protein
MSTLDKLITKVSELEEIASRIQIGTQIGLPTEQIDKLIEDYEDWYTDCLAILSEDLKENFRFEYEGNWHSFKIKRFLAAPTEVNPLSEAIDKSNPFAPPYWQYPYKSSFSEPIRTQRRILIQVSKQTNKQPQSKTDSADRAISSHEAITTIRHLARKFHLVVHQLNQRHNGRQPFVITDEYDVQDLFHALLRSFFEDIRDEEWSPSYGGRGSRIDFLLKVEQIVIEIKKTRNGLTAKEIGEQLIIDKARYHSHPDCKTLIAFVYDPDRRIANPRGLEADLSQTTSDMTTIVIINQG